MSRTIEFVHDIGTKINIKALDLPGYVASLMFDQEGLSYKVVYWSDGVRHYEWMFDWEIESK